MDPFSYLSVLIQIILALGMARLLTGLGDMLLARSRQKLYWVHMVWIANVFLYQVVAWWVFYRWRFEQHWPFWLFIFVLISPTILYVASVVLFPRDLDSSTASRNYRSHFYDNHRTFFLLLATYAPVDVADSWLKGTAHLLDLGASYFISTGFYL
jgi:hypothetical protein